MTPQRISMVTLAVKNLKKSRKFYKKLGFEEAEGGNDQIAFYKLGGQFFSLYSRDALTKDLCMPVHGRSTGGISLATNYTSREEVDAAYARAVEAGAIIVTEPTEVFWGGYSGNYADPDGHLWEVAHNPFWTLDENGLVTGDP
ncbi:glyoxalase [Amylibacter ulvae]|uniref:Glyoxalase n=1 Tax=Paramylibacter ulvae TaxID=1651968 RepID=A0ABQ3CXA1_9RHOB|nr:VOC family protein [Amylibacter ulvae]GHA46890.1 glyoxalase [Amylibacter ulvae]